MAELPTVVDVAKEIDSLAAAMEGLESSEMSDVNRIVLRNLISGAIGKLVVINATFCKKPDPEDQTVEIRASDGVARDLANIKQASGLIMVAVHNLEDSLNIKTVEEDALLEEMVALVRSVIGQRIHR